MRAYDKEFQPIPKLSLTTFYESPFSVISYFKRLFIRKIRVQFSSDYVKPVQNCSLLKFKTLVIFGQG